MIMAHPGDYLGSQIQEIIQILHQLMLFEALYKFVEKCKNLNMGLHLCWEPGNSGNVKPAQLPAIGKLQDDLFKFNLIKIN